MATANERLTYISINSIKQSLPLLFPGLCIWRDFPVSASSGIRSSNRYNHVRPMAHCFALMVARWSSVTRWCRGNSCRNMCKQLDLVSHLLDDEEPRPAVGIGVSTSAMCVRVSMLYHQVSQIQIQWKSDRKLPVQLMYK